MRGGGGGGADISQAWAQNVSRSFLGRKCGCWLVDLGLMGTEVARVGRKEMASATVPIAWCGTWSLEGTQDVCEGVKEASASQSLQSTVLGSDQKPARS